MSIGIVGKKMGMMRLFDEIGNHIPVTVVKAVANHVVQLKDVETDGYRAVQISYGEKKQKRLNKSEIGKYAKLGVHPGEGFCEFLVDDLSPFNLKDSMTVKQFEGVEHVDVTSVSKGKGFQGGVKRHNFHMQDATHGNSLSHRAIGSTGQNQSPGKVFKGKKMPGHMGARRVTVLSQKLVRVDTEENLLMVRGTVPGPTGSVVVVRSAIKKNQG